MSAGKDSSLAKGQVWKTPIADFEIMALGKDFIHYKVTKQLGAKRVSAQISGIEAMENYLKMNRAQLALSCSANN
jgi:hypothetical protein